MSSSYLSLDEKWKEHARYELNEDPLMLEDNIVALRTLVEGEPDLFSRTDETFLLAFLRARKHNVNEAFKLVKNFYKLKKTYPKHFEDCLPSEKGDVYDVEALTVLDQKDDYERIVMLARVENQDYRKVAIEKFFQQIKTALSYYCEDQHFQISGMVFIVDLKGYGFHQLRFITPTHVSFFAKMYQDSFPVRLKAIHVINEPMVFDALYAVGKPFLKEKLKKRIFVHGSNMASLHKHVPCEILPRQLGGMLPDFNFNSFRNKMHENEDMIKGWRKFGYNKRCEIVKQK